MSYSIGPRHQARESKSFLAGAVSQSSDLKVTNSPARFSMQYQKLLALNSQP